MFDSSQSDITFIDYDTNSAVTPELTLEIWVKPENFADHDVLLGHDDHCYDRAIY